jgi:hypothetical protein
MSLGGLFGGSQGGGGRNQQGGGDALQNILGTLLGGGQASTQSGGQGGLDLGSLLQGLLGGGSAGGLQSILGVVQGSAGTGSPLATIADRVAQQVGLPPEVAQSVTAFALHQLATAHVSRMAGAQAQPGAGVNLDDLVSKMTSQGVNQKYIQSTGLDQELARRTGLDAATASKSLTTVFNMMGVHGTSRAS